MICIFGPSYSEIQPIEWLSQQRDFECLRSYIDGDAIDVDGILDAGETMSSGQWLLIRLALSFYNSRLQEDHPFDVVELRGLDRHYFAMFMTICQIGAGYATLDVADHVAESIDPNNLN